MTNVNLSELGIGDIARIYTDPEDFLPEYSFRVHEIGGQPIGNLSHLINHTDLRAPLGSVEPPPPEYRVDVGPIWVTLEGCVDLDLSDDIAVLDDQLDELALALPPADGSLRVGGFIVFSASHYSNRNAVKRAILVPRIDRLQVQESDLASPRQDALV